MSLYVIDSSTHYGFTSTSLVTAAGFSTYPMCFGCWCLTTTTSGYTTAGEVMSVGQFAAGHNNVGLGVVNNGAWRITRDNGASSDILLKTAVANVWTFIFGRFISATNCRGGMLDETGFTQQGSDSTNITLSSLDTAGITVRCDTQGYTWLGYVGECWWTNADIYDSGQDLPTSMLQQLAYGGPLSLPSVRNVLVDYMPMRGHVNDPLNRVLGFKVGQQYQSRYGRQTWTGFTLNNTGSVGGPDPPIAVPTLRTSDPQQQLMRPAMSQLRRMIGLGVPSSALFRRTLSPFGSRTGSRQIQGYMNG